jgi:hypothetical protein
MRFLSGCGSVKEQADRVGAVANDSTQDVFRDVSDKGLATSMSKWS